VGLSCPVPALIVVPFYRGHGAWNDYLLNDGPDTFSATDTPCDPEVAGGPARCIHGGERLRLALPPTYQTCEQLELRDELDAFEWTCVELTDHVEFHSWGLRPERGLAALVDAAGWKPNRVRAWRAGLEVAASEPAIWWSNPVKPVPLDPDATVVLPRPGDSDYTIYTAVDQVSGGINLNADHLGFVVLPGHRLSFALNSTCVLATGEVGDGDSCMIAAGDQRFLWLEGELVDGVRPELPGNYHGVVLVGVQFSQLRDLVIDAGAYATLLTLDRSSANVVRRARVTGAENNMASVTLRNESHFNVLRELVVSRNRSVDPARVAGLFLEDARFNVAHAIAVNNVARHGVWLFGDGTIHNILSGYAFTGRTTQLQATTERGDCAALS
jgi:hypothetical protein